MRPTVTDRPFAGRRFRQALLVTIFAAGAAALIRGQSADRMTADTFKEFPAIQKPNTFTVDDALAKMSEAPGGG